MGKMCDNCGQELDEAATFCSLCGKKQDNVPQIPQQPQQQIVTCGKCGTEATVGTKFCGSCGELMETKINQFQPPNGGMIQAHPSKQNKSNIKPIAMVACAAVLLVVIIGAVFIFAGGNNPETILKRYLIGAMSQDFNALTKYSAYDFDNLIKEVYTAEGLTEKEFNQRLYSELKVKNLKELFDEKAREALIDLRKQYGSDYKTSFEIIDSSPVKQSEITNKIASLQSFFERNDYDGSKIIRLDKITEMIECEVEAAIKGSKDEDIDYIKIIMVKIAGKWRILDDINQFTRMF